jgi:hypothetical protein
LLETIAILLDGRDVLADGLGALDVGFQEIVLFCFDGKLLLRRVRGGGKLPTVSRQSDIRDDDKNHATENDSFPQCEVAPHQVLE